MRVKKAFTLFETAMVLAIISIIIGVMISTGTVALEKTKISSTKDELKVIKTSLISYAYRHHNLPGAGSGLEVLLDTLGTKTVDAFGQAYQYDVNLALTTTANKVDFCTALNALVGNPQVENTASTVSYSVAAVILSKGTDKVLTGKNGVAPLRTYEMQNNIYNETANDDLVIELSVYELISSICL